MITLTIKKEDYELKYNSEIESFGECNILKGEYDWVENEDGGVSREAVEISKRVLAKLIKDGEVELKGKTADCEIYGIVIKETDLKEMMNRYNEVKTMYNTASKNNNKDEKEKLAKELNELKRRIQIRK